MVQTFGGSGTNDGAGSCVAVGKERSYSAGKSGSLSSGLASKRCPADHLLGVTKSLRRKRSTSEARRLPHVQRNRYIADRYKASTAYCKLLQLRYRLTCRYIKPENIPVKEQWRGNFTIA